MYRIAFLFLSILLSIGLSGCGAINGGAVPEAPPPETSGVPSKPEPINSDSTFVPKRAPVGTASTPNCSHPQGLWMSTTGAKLHIKEMDPKTGIVKVSFKSPSRLFSDGPFEGVAYLGNTALDKEGRAHDKDSTIGFMIKFPKGEVSTWAGYCSEDKKTGVPSIKSIWTGVSPNVEKYIDHMRTHPTIFFPVDSKN